MNILKDNYTQIIRQDIINKFGAKNPKKIPKITKIVLNFGCKNISTLKLAPTILALELIANKRATATASRKPSVVLKIQKGQISGCKVELCKNRIYHLMLKLNIAILPKLKNFSKFKIQNQKTNFYCQLPGDSIKLKEFERLYPLFTDLPILDINIFTNASCIKESIFIAKAFKIPIFKTN